MPLPSDDPESTRVDALLARAVEGSISDAEREELVLHAEHSPAVIQKLQEAEAQGRLAHGWLQRVHRDTELATLEHSRRVRLERWAGLGLLLVGYVLSFWAPLVGAGAMGAGAVGLLVSFVRIRLATHDKDPYKDVVR